MASAGKESSFGGAALPGSCSVVVIGAGLSGLVTARELIRTGVPDVVVVEARDRVGGRLEHFTRSNGRTLQRGGEFVNPNGAAALLALGAELGLETETIPPYANEGAFVRVLSGERIVEAIPLETDPAAADAFNTGVAAFEALVHGVSASEPWNAPRAAELDRMTLGAWLDEAIPHQAAREAFYGEFMAFGDPYEVSLFYALWHVAGFGGLEHMATSLRFIGGAAQIPQLIAAELGDRVVLSAPVSAIEHTAEGVVVHTTAGAVSARSVVVAMEPSQCAKIEFSPALPASRDRLQARWLGGHGIKIFAIYDRPFWRDKGLVGVASSADGFIHLALDVSPSDAEEGVICAFFFPSNRALDKYSDTLGDAARTRETTLADLALFFGDEALEPAEFHVFDWSGDRWSDGCGGQVPTNLMSSVGRTLREPVGRIVWAGAETGDTDYLGGAVTSGQRAAREAAALLNPATG